MVTRTAKPDGEKIRQLRARKGWSQEVLARKSRCSKRTVENAEAGRSILLETLRRIAEARDLSEAGDLLPGEQVESAAEPQPQQSNRFRGSLPPLPCMLVGRDAALGKLRERLNAAAESERQSLQVLTAVHGWPGVGKTTIASALAHDAKMAESFPDGVLWASLGKSPDMLLELLSWGRACEVDLSKAKSIEQARSELAGVLGDKRALLIIDDVWEMEHAVALRVGGRHCATLVTTRLGSVAERLSPTPDDRYNLEVLDEESALELLRRLAPTVVEKHTAESRQLVRELEGLPLAIEVAGRLLNTHCERWEGADSSSVARLLQELRDGSRLLKVNAPANMTTLLRETTPTVAALLQKSTDSLDEEMRDRFAHLGAFASKPATFGLDYMAATWEVDEDEAQRIANELIDHGLLEPVENGRFWLHALLVSHARTLWT